VLVEVDEDSLGIERVSRGRDGVVEAGQRLTEALGSVRDAAQASMEVLQTLSPGRIELEFGVKLVGEAGAIIVNTPDSPTPRARRTPLATSPTARRD